MGGIIVLGKGKRKKIIKAEKGKKKEIKPEKGKRKKEKVDYEVDCFTLCYTTTLLCLQTMIYYLINI